MADTERGADGLDAEEPPSELPLPPYPDTVARPSLQFIEQIRDLFEFGDRALENDDVVRVRMLGADNYLLGHPDHLERALVSERDAFGKSEDFRIAFGDGLVASEGEAWRTQRTAMQPFFTREAVTDYADGMGETIRRRVDRWEAGDRIDLQSECADLALDVLFATLFGRELDPDGDRTIREAAEGLHGWFRPSSYVLPNWVPTPSRYRFRRAKRTLREETERLLEGLDDPPADPSEADDLLSLLVGIRGRGEDAALSDSELRDQMVTLVFAGHDTTATAILFSFWALAHDDEVRGRFHEEVDALDGPPSMADLEDLPVTERVLTEALRLYPPVYMIPRVATRPVAVGGYRIPEGARVMLPLRAIQRDGRFFEDPETFRPSRWRDDREEDRHDFAYAPFGAGPRLCIGRTFALMEAKLALSTIGRRYRLRWRGDNDGGEPPMDPAMTTRMESGQPFEIEER
jgi:cytochrome P450